MLSFLLLALHEERPICFLRLLSVLIFASVTYLLLVELFIQPELNAHSRARTFFKKIRTRLATGPPKKRIEKNGKTKEPNFYQKIESITTGEKMGRKSVEEQLKAIEKELDIIAPDDYSKQTLLNQVMKWAHLKGKVLDKYKVGNYPAFEYMAEQIIEGGRKDKFSKVLHWKLNGQWVPVELDVLKSIMHDLGFDTAMIKSHFANYVAGMSEELLIDLPEYFEPIDKDPIYCIAKCINSPAFETEELANILKDWMCGVWRRYQDHSQQNKLLLFRGAQGIGKDWIIRLLCQPLDIYFKQFTMQSQQKDVFEQASNCLVMNMSEFDQTETYHVSFLKDLITKYEAYFRPAYAQHAITRKFHCSFIGTTNEKYILRDVSGNRRFVIIDIDAIDWNEMQNQDYALAWSQARQLAAEGFSLDSSILGKMTAQIESETPENDLEQNILDLWNSAINYEMGIKQKERFQYTEVVNIIDDIRKKLHLKSARLINTVIKKNGGQVRSSGVRWYTKAVNLCESDLLNKKAMTEKRSLMTDDKLSSQITNFAILKNKINND